MVYTFRKKADKLLTRFGSVQAPKFAEIVTLRLGNGDMKRGQVLEVAGQKAVVQAS